jgi:methylmalonyl-CoA mutase, C-terminal domain
MSREKIIKVLIAKPGLDGHDRGAKVIARGLKEVGMEVVYTGLRQTPEEIVRGALQEDVNVIGLSILSGAHNHLFPEIMELLKKEGVDNILVIAGGIIPEEDHDFLKGIGIKAIFNPGTPIRDIVKCIKENLE